jgi:hypothetical protein
MRYVCVKCAAVEKQQVLLILNVCSLSYLTCNIHALHYTVTYGLFGSIILFNIIS